MARKFSDGDLEQLKRNISIEELCRSRGIEVKKHGSRDLIGKCPFHEDDTPSFVISPEKNLFHCLGCDAGGSVIDLVMKLDSIEFKDAVQKLLASTGLVRPASETPKRPAVPPEKASTLLERVVAVYEKTFAEVPEGRAYLETRGITDAGLFSAYRVGFANGKLKDLLPSDGAVREELKAVGVLLDNGHERFAGCVTFPVYGPDGRLITIYGRFTGEGPKRHVFLPERSTGLWNVAAAKTYPSIILVESVIDALSVMMAGNRNVMAIQGTNGFSDATAALLKTHGVHGVTWMFDGDEAGRKATERLKEKLAFSFRCQDLALPDEEDPNSFLVKHGAQRLAQFILEGRDIAADTRAMGETPSVPSGISFIPRNREAPLPPGPVVEIDNVRPGGAGDGSNVVTYGLRKYRIMGLEKGPRKLKATLRVEHGGKLHVDTLDFYSAKSRRVLAMDLCRLFEEMLETIEGDLDKLLRHCEALPEKPSESENGKSQSVEMTAAEREEAEAFGKSPAIFDAILADGEQYGLMGERSNVLLLYVAMTSRKRDKPISVLILSSSGAGKTALQDAVLAFCPPEDLVKLTSLSGKALFYKDRLSLKNKVLALEEGDGAEEASYAIRNLISAGELTSESTIKDLATGRLVTMENKVEGPTPVFLTTTNPEIDPETKSRFWVTSIDESREQTRKILSFQRHQHESDGLITSPEIEAVLKKHRNFQRLLKPVAVKNPYAPQLTYGDDRLQGRRDQPKYLNLIKAIAFLRQLQKPIFGVLRKGLATPYIKVDRDDIRLANQLTHELLGHSLDELSRPGRDLLHHLEEMIAAIIERLQKEDKDCSPERAAISFSRRDIREFTGWSHARVHRYLKELTELEYVIQDTGRNGTLCRYRLAWEGQGKGGGKFLLGLTDPEKLTESNGN